MGKNKETRFADPVDLIKSINPQMSAEQAVAQIREYNRLEFNRTKVPVIQARRKLLEESGCSPDDWTFYSNTLRLDDQSNEEMMQSLAREFPSEVEFLVVQGAVLGGVSVGQSSWAVVKYDYNPDHYTAFIRVRPKQLKG